MNVDRPDEVTVEDALPSGAETVVWVSDSDFHLYNAGDYDEEIFPDDLDLSPVPARYDGETDPTIIYEAGDEVPLPVARDNWAGWHGSMAAFDVDNRRLDEPGRNEDSSALKLWKGRVY